MSADKLLKKIKDENIKFVDLRFTDPRGKMQHVTFHSDLVDEDLFQDGTMFDGSSIGGWKDINESDMVLLPDASTAKMDPFYQPTKSILAQKLNFSSLMTCAGIQTRTSQVTQSIAQNCHKTRVHSTKAEIWVIAQVQRAATSLSRQLIAPKTCAAKCSLSWKSLACVLKSIIMKLPPLSTS